MGGNVAIYLTMYLGFPSGLSVATFLRVLCLGLHLCRSASGDGAHF